MIDLLDRLWAVFVISGEAPQNTYEVFVTVRFAVRIVQVRKYIASMLTHNLGQDDVRRARFVFVNSINLYPAAPVLCDRLTGDVVFKWIVICGVYRIPIKTDLPGIPGYCIGGPAPRRVTWFEFWSILGQGERPQVTLHGRRDEGRSDRYLLTGGTAPLARGYFVISAINCRS